MNELPTYETRVRETEVRQIARCKRCKAVHSQLVTKTTRIEINRRVFPEHRSYHHSHSVNGATPERFFVCECGYKCYFRDVEGRRNDAVPCDARCTSARGHKCECSCGGRNHGSDH